MSSSTPSSSSILCIRRCCRSPSSQERRDEVEEDTWMEPCRPSSKSKRRQSSNLDPTNNASLAEPLLGEQRNKSATTTRPSSDFSSFSSPIATDTIINNINERRINLSSFSDATPQINNCSKNAASLQTNDNSNNSNNNSNKWRPFGDYGLRSPREAMKGLVTKLSSSASSKNNSSSNTVVEDVKSKFAAIHPNNNTLNTKRNNDKEKVEGHAPITSIVILENGFVLTACRSDKYIKLWRMVDSSEVAIPQKDEEKNVTVSNETHDNSKDNNSNSNSSSIVKENTTHKIEYIHKFKGHISGIIDIIKFDYRGRFLSTSVDKSVKLWELDCTTNNNSVEVDDWWGPNLLANFVNLDKRWIKSIAILDKGSFVRPTDDINMSMVKAMARKTVLEGPSSMQQAAYNRSIIQCSGSFATSSKNGKFIKVWDMTVLDNKAVAATAEEREDDSSVTNIMMKNNVAKVCLVQELQHDAAVEVIKATEDGQTIISGDVMGDIFLWRKSSSNKSLLSGFKGTTKSSSWSLIHKFTWRDDIDNKRGSGAGIIDTPDVIFQHSITSLCFLLDDGSKFVSGTKEGLVQIWNGNDNKLPPQTIRVAEVPLSSIQKLPSNDNDDKLEGLSVCCADGSIVALKLVMEDGEVVELDAFPVDCSKSEIGGGSESSVISSINSVALPCKDKMGPATSSKVMLIAGDDKGNIHLTNSPLD